MKKRKVHPIVNRRTREYERVFRGQTSCFIAQQIEQIELLVNFETENKYDVTMTDGMKLYCAEESDVFMRCCCGTKRPFKIHCMREKKEVLTLQRDCYCCLSDVSVIDPVTSVRLGKVKQKFSLCGIRFGVYRAGEKKYSIKAGCCCPRTFRIENLRGVLVGTIKKQWGGLIKEMMTDADNFGITFPREATNEDKAILFGAAFMIDYLFFEKNNNKKKRRR